MLKKKLKDLLFEHNNNYGFDPLDLITGEYQKFPNLSIIIPYYNTGTLVKKTIKHLYNSIDLVLKTQPDWKYEVIVIDDGSNSHPLLSYKIDQTSSIKILINKKNLGRSFTRQRGLENAIYDICLFLDSDVLIDKTQLLNHLKLHSVSSKLGLRNFICVSFFEFGDLNHHLLNYKQIIPSDLHLNDFRLHCHYGHTWVGCKEDQKFIGMNFNIVHDTNYFKDWEGMYYAWALSNMVLGGLFSAHRRDCLKVGGFNLSFRGYGFTETTIVTKLIAINGNYVLPVLIGGGLHVENPKINHTRAEKDVIFWRKHDLYFNKYLYLSEQEAINDIQT